jgi:hypothetical protein
MRPPTLTAVTPRARDLFIHRAAPATSAGA